jgi:Flp pilus assembly protein TadG
MWCQRLRQLQACLRWLSADERGGVAVYVAIALPLLLGSVGMGVDVGLAYTSRQAAQHQADAAAMAAALELARGKTADEAEAAATTDAEENGFVDTRGDTIEVESPPTSGAFAGDAEATEVQITRPVTLTFVGFVGAERNITVTARAVAKPVRSAACVWSLEEINTGVGLTGTADVELNCGVYARSTSGAAIAEGQFLPYRHLGGDSRRCDRRLHPSDPTHQCCPARRSAGRAARASRVDHVRFQ